MDKFLKGYNNIAKKVESQNQNQTIRKDKEDDKQFLPWVEKYRPNNLEEVVYQMNVVNALKTSKQTGKLPHLLLYGPPGTGKTSTILAVKY
jgi:replication-associated recombination protein RarA